MAGHLACFPTSMAVGHVQSVIHTLHVGRGAPQPITTTATSIGVTVSCSVSSFGYLAGVVSQTCPPFVECCICVQSNTLILLTCKSINLKN